MSDKDINTDADSRPAEPDHIRFGHSLKALCVQYGLKEVNVTVRPHTEGEEITYRWLKAKIVSPADMPIWGVEDVFTCERKIASRWRL